VRLFKSCRPEYTDGNQRRDFVYVKDAVDMTLHLAESPGAHGIYNVGSGRSHTWRELAQAVFEALGRPVQIDFIDMPAAIRDSYQYATEASMERLRCTGYRRAVTPLADAIREYVRHYLVPGRRLGDEPGKLEQKVQTRFA
jgi:ADP-L-glycero-D-manno-heptose 6-epimerase